MKQNEGWPLVSMAETVALLTAPGAPYEMETLSIRGVPTRVYKNAGKSLRDLFDRSRAFGSREFLIYAGDRISFDAHWRAATALGHRLRSDYRVKPGDRVALCLRNYPEWSVAAWAILAIGAVLTPINAWASREEILSCLADAGATILFADAERLDRLGDEAGRHGVATIGIRAQAGQADRNLEEMIGRPAAYGALPDAPLPDLAVDPDSHATLFFTSGTTGRPKGVIGTHRNIMSALVDVTYRAARAAVRRGEAPPPPSSLQRTILLPVPLFHVTGFSTILVPAFAAGNRIVLMYKWDPAQAIELIERERVNGMTAVPTMYRQLLEMDDLARHDLSSLDALSVGGAAAGAGLIERIGRVFPTAAVGQGYGMTETTAGVATNSAEDQLARPQCAGPPCPACEIRVVDEAGADVGPGETGELWIKGPGVAAGYWNDAQATADAFVDGWYRTGDIVRVDEDQFIEVLDRRKDIIIRGGENIHCGEIEEILRRHAAVREIAIIGLPDELFGEQVAAVLRLSDGSDLDAVRDHAQRMLPPHKRPVGWHVWPQPLPSNAAGKIMKAQIKQEIVRAGADRQTDREYS